MGDDKYIEIGECTVIKSSEKALCFQLSKEARKKLETDTDEIWFPRNQIAKDLRDLEDDETCDLEVKEWIFEAKKGEQTEEREQVRTVECKYCGEQIVFGKFPGSDKSVPLSAGSVEVVVFSHKDTIKKVPSYRFHSEDCTGMDKQTKRANDRSQDADQSWNDDDIPF